MTMMIMMTMMMTMMTMIMISCRGGLLDLLQNDAHFNHAHFNLQNDAAKL